MWYHTSTVLYLICYAVRGGNIGLFETGCSKERSDVRLASSSGFTRRLEDLVGEAFGRQCPEDGGEAEIGHRHSRGSPQRNGRSQRENRSSKNSNFLLLELASSMRV